MEKDNSLNSEKNILPINNASRLQDVAIAGISVNGAATDSNDSDIDRPVYHFNENRKIKENDKKIPHQ
ncbi:hypothetical protein E3U55_11935 [Filobacillus milosensis]|uniref:Uncharacterized protein n=1 Tax=Filobacillus milosensis TaxID=94137 RepID=A0A4Y8IHV5_9BACI|nr:hypothetical protein [Filobacillus milosensis]TFB18497.1 hypothetical protein E3U55_11935 [Filobacillus milosensis]